LAAYFFDSSALAKLYHPEVGTPTVDRIIETAENRIRISRLTVVELPSVFAIKVRTQFINRDDAGVFLRQFREDIISRSSRFSPCESPNSPPVQFLSPSKSITSRKLLPPDACYL
jgi:predicted nucleic acid-binding protein